METSAEIVSTETFLNSFEKLDKIRWWKKNSFLWLFLLVTIFQTGLLYIEKLKFSSDADDSLLDSIALSVDFGDIINKSSGSVVVEVDEVFGNEYIKDKPVDPNATEDPRISGAIDPVAGNATAPVDLNPEIVPEYTSDARSAGVEGTVTLEIIVSDDGKVLRVRSVGRKLGYGLEDSAIHSFKKKRYAPSKAEGKAITVKFYQPVRFSLVR